MNPFDPSNLSPLPTPETACPLPYDLTWADLLPILPGCDSLRLDQAQAFSSHAKQGLNGGENSAILTLHYPGEDAQTHTQTVFLKQISDPLKAEAQKYRYLASHGVPAPRLLAELRKGAVEILVLEFLPAIGIDFQSPSEIDSLLRLVAQVNSLPIPPDLFTPLPGMPQDVFEELVRGALIRLSTNPGLPPVDAPRWFAAYLKANHAVKDMALAINHNEFFFQQIGWAQRDAARQLVIFDLETMAFTPRFTDIAGVLYALAAYTGRSQEELFQRYLEHCQQYTSVHISMADALRELHLVRIVDICSSLPWLTSPETGDLVGIDVEDALSMAVRCLRDDIAVLGLA